MKSLFTNITLLICSLTLSACGDSGSDDTESNQTPIVNAGTDQTVDESTLVTLSGSGNDSDGSIASYSWSQTSGPSVTLSAANTASVTFTAPDISEDETLVFQLTVTDDQGASSTDSVSVNVIAELVNQAPVITAQKSHTSYSNGRVYLTVEVDDETPESLSIEWTQTKGQTVELIGADQYEAYFDSPDISTAMEVLQFVVNVTDIEGLSSSQMVTVFNGTYAHNVGDELLYVEVPDSSLTLLGRDDLTSAHSNSLGGHFEVWDFGNDGDEDIIYAGFYGIEGTAHYEPVKGVIHIIENQGGTLELVSSQKIDDYTIDLAIRRIKSADFNGDGEQDFVFAANAEDGRTGTDVEGEWASTPNYLLLSQPDGKFVGSEIGSGQWTHEIVAGDIDNDGIVEVIDGSYTTSPLVYEISKQGVATLDPVSFNNINEISANNTMIGDFNDDGCLDFFASKALGPYDYFQNDCSGNFEKQLRIGGGDEFYEVPGLTYSNDETLFTYIILDGQWYLDATVNEAVVFDHNNDGRDDILFFLSGAIVSEQDKANNYVYQSNAVSHSLPILVTNTENGLEVDYNAIPKFDFGVSIDGVNAADLNQDGKLDIVIRSHVNSQLSSYIYLNVGWGKFIRLEGNVGERDFQNVAPIFIDDANQSTLVTINGDQVSLLKSNSVPIIAVD